MRWRPNLKQNIEKSAYQINEKSSIQVEEHHIVQQVPYMTTEPLEVEVEVEVMVVEVEERPIL